MPDQATADPEATQEKSPAARLTAWLCGLVLSHATGTLADLRRPTALTEGRLIAASFAPQEQQRPIYEQVAFLFARYHAGASRPQPGIGSMGTAIRRIGSPAGTGPHDPGATRLMDRITASRDIPWRHLQHAVERARAAETIPPSWAQLVDDLVRWKDRDQPRAGDLTRRFERRAVPYAWARDFYTPGYSEKNGNAK